MHSFPQGRTPLNTSPCLGSAPETSISGTSYRQMRHCSWLRAPRGHGGPQSVSWGPPSVRVSRLPEEVTALRHVAESSASASPGNCQEILGPHPHPGSGGGAAGCLRSPPGGPADLWEEDEFRGRAGRRMSGLGRGLLQTEESFPTGRPHWRDCRGPVRRLHGEPRRGMEPEKRAQPTHMAS